MDRPGEGECVMADRKIGHELKQLNMAMFISLKATQTANAVSLQLVRSHCYL